MSPPQRARAWNELVEWVAWLHDRYELSVANRLPICWPGHPGLIEELWALKLWRGDIYSTQDSAADREPAGLGQPARYWHSELHNVITRAEQFYASKCRSGHKPTKSLTDHPDTIRQWRDADPLVGVNTRSTGPEAIDDSAGRTTVAGCVMTTALMRGTAKSVNNTAGHFAWFRGSWWTVDGPNWITVLDTAVTAGLDAPPARLGTTNTATSTEPTRTP